MLLFVILRFYNLFTLNNHKPLQKKMFDQCGRWPQHLVLYFFHTGHTEHKNYFLTSNTNNQSRRRYVGCVAHPRGSNEDAGGSERRGVNVMGTEPPGTPRPAQRHKQK